ncbi:hypothetical protein MMYC01_206505 [Madurella mycetomatis]|uniref:Uncharacterized protein n=1 Tax=Madurella mycetomatis TaxID=100816 RepID=A0A175W4V8_9PEZI|nr:hypothetical protein MMYC01_206505 [Madurella mycetomatis]
MAPAPPARRQLTLKAAEKKRSGPAPKPLTEGLRTNPAKQIRRVERSYSRERKIEVLLYLLNHRVPDVRPRRVPRRRIGQPHEQELTRPMVRTETGEYVWYRAPTYAEASEFWKIPTPTIQGWWDSREKLLKGTGIEVPTVGPGGLSAELAAAGASTVPNRRRRGKKFLRKRPQCSIWVKHGALRLRPPGPGTAVHRPQSPSMHRLRTHFRIVRC